jgi:hypothetical protein
VRACVRACVRAHVSVVGGCLRACLRGLPAVAPLLRRGLCSRTAPSAARGAVACREDIFKEIDILCGLNHPNVVHLREYFEEGNKVRLASRAAAAPSTRAWCALVSAAFAIK